MSHTTRNVENDGIVHYGDAVARMADLHDDQRRTLEELPLPAFESRPFVEGAPLRERRVAIVSTAGVHRAGDRPFAFGSRDYRVIPGDTDTADIVMSHVSSNGEHAATTSSASSTADARSVYIFQLPPTKGFRMGGRVRERGHEGTETRRAVSSQRSARSSRRARMPR